MKIISPFMSFLAASAIVHAALVINSYSTNITLPGSTGSVMTVKLQAEKVPNKQALTGKQLEAKQVNKKILKEKHSPVAEPPTQKTQALAKTTTLAPYSDSTNKENLQVVNKERESKSRAHVIAVIYQALNQHFTYPRLAQRRNWQGKVLLSIRVTASGKIKNIKLNQSSGYAILDQAAMSSLTKVGELPQLISWLPYDIDLTLPVIYQLTEG